MDHHEQVMAEEIAQLAGDLQHQRTGHMPDSVTAVFCADTLVIALDGALSPAEKLLARSPEGAAKVQEFHRQLFQNSSHGLRQEISRITGRRVRESAAEVEPATGGVVHAFTTGEMVQIFSLDTTTPALADGGAG